MSALRDELTNDPEARGYAGMTAAEALADLSEKRYSLTGLIPIGTFISTLYDSGTFDQLFMAMLGGNQVAQAAMEKLKLMKALGIENIDMGADRAKADLAASGVPDADISALIAKATKPASRLDVLGITASEGEIIEARK